MKNKHSKKVENICKKFISSEMLLFAAYSMTLLRSEPQLYFMNNGQIREICNNVLQITSHNLISYAKKNQISLPKLRSEFLSLCNKDVSKAVDLTANFKTSFEFMSNLMKAELGIIKDYSSLGLDAEKDPELKQIVDKNLALHRENAEKIEEIIRKEP